jgi:arsenite-transporting ATPase
LHFQSGPFAFRNSIADSSNMSKRVSKRPKSKLKTFKSGATDRDSKRRSKPPRLTFFLGKGGVGKTTVGTAYALNAASQRGNKVVLISTDPAHSLADVLNVSLKSGLQTLRSAGSSKLSVWQVDAGARFEEFLDEYRDAITNLVEQGTFLSKKEIDSFLETTLPGLAEVSALLTISDLLESGKFDEIVVDTAPIGHTLQLFRIPTQLSRFLEFLELSGKRDQVLAQTFGGNVAARRPAVLDQWDAVLTSLRAALSSEQAKLVMVTSAEKFSLEEAARTAQILEDDASAQIAEVVINRVVTRAGRCSRCQQRAHLYAAAEKFVAQHFPDAGILVGEDPGAPLIGADNLRSFGQHVFDKKPLKLKTVHPKRAKALELKTTKWPATKTQLTLTLGKGGVGKTTISGGLAYVRRQQNPRGNLLICSTDPAPSLDDLFEQQVGATPKPVLHDKRFGAVEVDSTAEYLAWSRKVKHIIADSLQVEQGSLHVELSLEHEMISALLDIVPPGVDEIFAVFKLLDLIEARNLALVIDMAPTGHALELLRTPERLVVWTRLLLKSLSAHSKLPLAQDLAVEVASISQRARELVKLLKDRKAATVFVVMLPEPLPDRQTTRLLDSLTELGMKPAAVFVNRVLPETDNCPRCRLAREWQLATLARLPSGRLPHYVVPDFDQQIAGKEGLERLTQTLLQNRRR